MAKRRKRKVSLMGTNSLGQVTGIHPVLGAAVGGGLQTAGAIGVRQFVGMDEYSELIGAGIGAVGSGLLMLSSKTRAAGLTGMVTSIVVGGLRFAAGMISTKEKFRNVSGELFTHNEKKAEPKFPGEDQLKAIEGLLEAATATKAATTAGALGIVTANQVPNLSALGRGPLGAVSQRRMRSLGAQAAYQVPLASGDLGVPQAESRQLAQAPVQIVGANGIGRHFGATVFG